VQKKLRTCFTALIILTTSIHAADFTANQAASPLLTARKGFQTKLLPATSEPIFVPDKPSAAIYELAHYQSNIGALAAYISPDPHDGKKHPIVIWAHGGFSGIGDYFFTRQPDLDDQSPHFFQEAGILVMAPSWRGENNNPGSKEMFFGEVDDALAAIKYVQSLSYIDRGRIYFAGHSTGGTMALLTAEASTQIRATFSFGATADLSVIGWKMPFNRDDPDEIRLRSAINFVAGIGSPTFCIEGSRSPNGTNFPALQTAADREKTPLHTFLVSHGSHFNILHPITQLLAQKILADIGSSCNITLTKEELDKAFSDFMQKLAKDRKTPLVTLTAEAGDFLKSQISSIRVDVDKVFLRFDLDAADHTTTRLVRAIQVGDMQLDSQGIHLLVSPEANNYLEPLVLGFDRATNRLRLESLPSP
jgi:hypothetical protein